MAVSAYGSWTPRDAAGRREFTATPAPLTVGDRARVMGYGKGAARRIDVGQEGTITAVHRTHVDLTLDSPRTSLNVLRVAGYCLGRLD